MTFGETVAKVLCLHHHWVAEGKCANCDRPLFVCLGDEIDRVIDGRLTQQKRILAGIAEKHTHDPHDHYAPMSGTNSESVKASSCAFRIVNEIESVMSKMCTDDSRDDSWRPRSPT